MSHTAHYTFTLLTYKLLYWYHEYNVLFSVTVLLLLGQFTSNDEAKKCKNAFGALTLLAGHHQGHPAYNDALKKRKSHL